MSAASRRKGLTGEREVADTFAEYGWELRGLEGSGDWLALRGSDIPAILHLEVKRQERLRLPEWLEQARTEAPQGVPAVVCFRRNRGEWHVALPLSDFLELIG